MRLKLITVLVFCFLIFNTIISASSGKIIDKNETITIKSIGDKYALFVQGVGNQLFKESDDAAEATTNYAKRIFDGFGFKTKKLTTPTRNELEQVLTVEIPEFIGNDQSSNDKKQVFIYFICHGSQSGTMALSGNPFGFFRYVTTYDLKEWIGELESKCNLDLSTIVIESCYSGKYLNALKNDKRIIITATDRINSAYGAKLDDGSLINYFSDTFFKAIAIGKTYGRAWEIADTFVDNGICPESQNPKICDDYGEVGSEGPDKLLFPLRLSLRTSPSTIIKSKQINQKVIISLS